MVPVNARITIIETITMNAKNAHLTLPIRPVEISVYAIRAINLINRENVSLLALLKWNWMLMVNVHALREWP